MKEKKGRVEDALHATRAAVEEGIVAGGGVALIRAQPGLDSLELLDEERFGVQIVRRAIEEPLRQIAAKRGHGGRGRRERRSRGQGRLWLQRRHRRVRQLDFGMGVIDPVKVVRTALENAASVAGLMLTTECLIAEREKADPAARHHSHGDD